MWNESQRSALAQIGEDDKIAATAVPWRYLTGPAKVMLEWPERQANNWEWLSAVGLGAWYYRRRVPAAVVVGYLGQIMTGLEQEARGASLDRTVPADEWALRMAGISERSALVAGAFAVGGWSRLDVVRGDVEAHLASELGYLDAFADDVAAGRVPRDGRFVRRATLYGAAGWGLYMMLRGREARRRGYGEERSLLDPGAEHCAECAGEADKGWRPLGELIPIGSRQCRSGCRCRMEYRNAAGEVVE